MYWPNKSLLSTHVPHNVHTTTNCIYSEEKGEVGGVG